MSPQSNLAAYNWRHALQLSYSYRGYDICREMWRLGWWLLFLDKGSEPYSSCSKEIKLLWRLWFFTLNCTFVTILIEKLKPHCYTYFLHITQWVGNCFYFSFPQHQSCRGLVDVLLTTHMHAPEHPYMSANGLGSSYSSIAEKERERKSASWNIEQC